MSQKAKEFREMSEGELNDKLAELRLELIKQNAQIATGTTPKSPGLVRETKRNIARILTILKSKAAEPKVEVKKEVKPKAKPKTEKKAPAKPKKKVVKTSGKRSSPEGAQKPKVSDKETKKQEGVDKKV